MRTSTTTSASAAEAPHVPVLQHAQELDLRGRGQLADLVEEQRPARRLLDEAHAIAHGVGERALEVPEELRLDEPGRDGAAVDGHERRPGARRERVQRPRDELLARPRLARGPGPSPCAGATFRSVARRAAMAGLVADERHEGVGGGHARAESIARLAKPVGIFLPCPRSGSLLDP